MNKRFLRRRFVFVFGALFLLGLCTILLQRSLAFSDAFDSARSGDWKRCVSREFRGFPPLSEYETTGRRRPVIVLAWDPLEDFLFVGADAVRQCSVPCLFVAAVRDDVRDCLAQADAVVFNPPTTLVKKYRPRWSFAHQSNVLFLTESEAIWGALPDLMRDTQSNISLSYRLDADVPMTYFIGLEQYVDRTYFAPVKRATAPVVMFISNCESQWVKSARGRFIQELMQYIEVHSYGKCFNNRQVPAELSGKPWWEIKWNITSQYRFTLAFENSIARDYVTEKLYHALVVGSVPVYWGAPNVERFLPAPNAAIRVDDFSSAHELAQHLHYLLDHEDEYDLLLSWKRSGVLADSFRALQSTSPRSAPCRLCESVAKRQGRRA